MDSRRLRISEPARDGRDVRGRYDSRSATSARPLHGTGSRLRPAAHWLSSLADLCGALRRTRAGASRLSAPPLGDAQSDCAYLSSLVRLVTHHLRADHDGALSTALEGRDVVLQRPRAGSASPRFGP